ncbi:rod shape-determining protein [Actinoplanes utahensis]|uniref:rod shape-determining protein n=1 Tax=Actinoplanes utahensis TaxID=1869 RepID=UPI001269F899|nr:rod shape-determining protein [Actinoplanes utahensis]
MPEPLDTPSPARRAKASAGPSAPVAVAVDLGSSTAGVWATGRGIVSGPSGGGPVRRGRVADVAACADLLAGLVRRYPQPLSGADMVVACRPVLSTETDEALMRRVLDSAFAPRRIMFIDTVRAAAIGSGAATGMLLIADVGTRITETALLDHGRVVAARRADIGTGDLGDHLTAGLLADVVARHVTDLAATAGDGVSRARERGLLLIGDGALHPELPEALTVTVGLNVRRAADPCTAALQGAGLAATSALRHPALQ